MTFMIIGSECAPGRRDTRPTAGPGIAQTTAAATTDLVRLFALDHLPAKRLLTCRWRRQLDGRLACLWEPDIVPIPQR